MLFKVRFKPKTFFAFANTHKIAPENMSFVSRTKRPIADLCKFSWKKQQPNNVRTNVAENLLAVEPLRPTNRNTSSVEDGVKSNQDPHSLKEQYLARRDQKNMTQSTFQLESSCGSIEKSFPSQKKPNKNKHKTMMYHWSVWKIWPLPIATLAGILMGLGFHCFGLIVFVLVGLCMVIDVTYQFVIGNI